MSSELDKRSIVVLAGGVGGARFGHGVQQVVAPGNLTMIVNTGDDFDHFGLQMCTDLDTVMYTLADRENPETGWGVRDDTRNTLDALAAYGEEPWFMVGDRDFATHIVRTRMLREGASLAEATDHLAQRSGVVSRIVPMTNAKVATIIETPDGPLAFQDYFVARRQRDDVIGISFDGIEGSAPSPAALEAVAVADLIVIAPSNPLVSIGPILAVPGMREALIAAPAPIVATSPIVGGKALKGPADRMLRTLGHEPSASGVARLYGDLLDGYVFDVADAGCKAEIASMGLQTLMTDSIMSDPDKRRRLASEVLETPWFAR